MHTAISANRDTGDHTTIILNKYTRDNLKKIGQKGQTYDDLIQKMIKKWNDEN